MEKINLLGSTIGELENLMLALGEPKYRGRQLFKWFYCLRQSDFKKMSDLPQRVQQKLAKGYIFIGLSVAKKSQSIDGTQKFLFTLHDGKYIETVLIPDKDKATVCVSSQIGCPLTCGFCATGQMGFMRNLTAGEIIGQLLYLRDLYGDNAFENIVFMGMGEPLLNHDNMIFSIRIISSEIGLSLSAKKITVSTIGIIPQIYKLADSGLKVNLAISLHAATDDKRLCLMPKIKAYPLRDLMEAAKYFARARKRRVTFEYILFDGFNDTIDDVKNLSNLIKGVPCKINLLAYNPIQGSPYRRPSEEKVNEFGKLLYPRVPAVTIRKSRGGDIEAACGQLAGKFVKYDKRSDK
jgi:23S rRNA (adenine2503-C2)-methyltransferase